MAYNIDKLIRQETWNRCTGLGNKPMTGRRMETGQKQKTK